MADAEGPEKGQLGARTPRAQNSGAAGEGLEAIEAWAVPGEQLDLLGQVAERSNQVRRAGRPPGAANKRNDETFDYLEARGFKAPEVRLMEIVSADPRELAARLAGQDDPKAVPFDRAFQVLQLQVKAAGELMPYKLARKPQQHEIKKAVAHLFVAGSLLPDQAAQIEQNQWLGDASLAGEGDNVSRVTVEIETDQGDR